MSKQFVLAVLCQDSTVHIKKCVYLLYVIIYVCKVYSNNSTATKSRFQNLVNHTNIIR